MLTLYVTKTSDAREAIKLLDASGKQWRQVTLSMGSEAERKKWQALKETHGWSTLPMLVAGERTIGGVPEARDYLQDDTEDATGVAQALGIGGLIPFVAIAGCLLADVQLTWLPAETALLAYAATILSFVGALQWGLAVAGSDQPKRRYALSILPSLCAWGLLLTPTSFQKTSVLFAVAFVAWYAIERITSWRQYPRWFQRLRSLLTGIVSGSLLAVGLLA
ncbi:MAG: DUF3429 family protein [Pseudomonadota bacterium]